MNYESMINNIAGQIKKEASLKEAPKKKEKKDLDAVQKAAQDILFDVMKTAAEEEEEELELSERALKALGLMDILTAEDREETEEEAEEDGGDRSKESDEYEEDDDEDTGEDEMDDEEEDVKTARDYLLAALAIEKEAQEAYEEAQLIKASSIKVLYEHGAIGDGDVEKVASLTIDDIIK